MIIRVPMLRGCGGNRGSLLLGMAGLIVVLAAMSATVLYRSLDTYRSAKFHVSRLQATAAAEGAAVAWRLDPRAAGEALMIGDSRVIPSPSAEVARTPTDSNTTAVLALRLPFRVEVVQGAKPIYAANYAALYSPSGPADGGWKLTRLETLP